MTSRTPVINVVDGDAHTRAALADLIRSAGWMARAFASAGEFLNCPRLRVPGCLVTDVRLPDLDGLQLQQQLVSRAEMPIIFMTRHFDLSTTVRAMKAGAFEFMTKPYSEDVMLSAIGAGIEHSRAALSREAELELLHARYELLSCRERQVMVLVVQGWMNKVIAADLGISEITVKAHRGRMMLKMRARSVAELVTLAARLDMPSGRKANGNTNVLTSMSNRSAGCALL